MEIRKNTRSFSFLAFITAGILLSGCSISTATDYEKELLTFKKNRVTSLKSRSGYLNLVGLHWIAEGKSQFGSDPGNEFVFPKEFPANFGSVTKKGDRFIFNFRETVLLDSAEKVMEFEISLGDIDHTFSWKSFQWFIYDAGGYYAIRLRHFENPVLDQPFIIPYFPVDKKWIIHGKYEPYSEVRPREISNVFDQKIEMKSTGIVTFIYNDVEYRLETEGSGEKLYCIFMDGTTGKDTYTGGRVIKVKGLDKTGNVYLDFNQAYNFPCAYNVFTTCPVPPPINHLDLKITAGARDYKKK